MKGKLFVLGFVFMLAFSGFVIGEGGVIEQNFGELIFNETVVNEDCNDFINDACTGYFGRYNLNGEVAAFASIENHEVFSNAEFIAGIVQHDDAISSFEKRELLGNNVMYRYVSDESGKATTLIWYSDRKVIYLTVGPLELSYSDDPLIEAMLAVYFEEYPSWLIFDVSNVTAICEDSDGGKDIYEKGYLTNHVGVNFEDYCISDYSLLERYCGDDPNAFSEDFYCDAGCYDGACLDQGEPFVNDLDVGECYDSDGGADPDVRGITYDHGEQYLSMDSCSGDDLIEYYCVLNVDGTQYRETEATTCIYGCSDGSCDNPETLPEEGVMSVDINKGWNLIYGFVEPDQIMNGNIPENDIRAIYALMPNMQEYARAWPDPEWDKLGTLDDDYLLNTGMWVYSDRDGYIDYKLYTDVIPYWERELYDGWNFIGITEDILGSRLGDITGDCDIIRSYVFDSDDQRWEELSLDVVIDDDEAIGQTWVINVDDNCNLGETPSIIPAPPILPEIDSDGGSSGGGSSGDEPLEIEGYVLIDVRTEEDCDEFNEGGVSGEVCMVMTNLRYENLDIGDSVYVTLIDYTKGFEVFKEIIGQYFTGVSSEYEYAYDLDGDNAIVWFSAGLYDIVVSERGDDLAANHVTNYFYNKYPAYDAGIAVVERCRDSDGYDIYTRGSAYLGEDNWQGLDVCWDEEYVNENYCSDNQVYTDTRKCPNGCYEGACIIPNGGYDSDGGVNYEEQGTCIDDKEGHVRTYTDNCGYWYDGDYNPNVLTEWKADTEFGCWGEQYECENDCYDGACVGDNYNVVDMTNAEIKAEIERLWINEEKRVVVYPDSQQTYVSPGKVSGFAIAIKNLLLSDSDEVFSYEVIVSDEDIQQKCGVSESQAEDWIAIGQSEILQIASEDFGVGVIRFEVPMGVAPCTFRYRINVDQGGQRYASEVIDITIQS